MRSLLLGFLLVITVGLGATGGGPGDDPVLSKLGLSPDSLLRELLGREPVVLLPNGSPVSTLARLSGPRSVAEEAALRSAFAAPPALSETGDDLRAVAAIADDLRGRVDSARAILAMVADPARRLSSLLDAQLANLPLAIGDTIGNVVITLAISEARLTPLQAEVDLVLGLDLPDTDQDPIFEARNIGFSRRGGFGTDVELVLISDWGIDFNQGRSRLILHKTLDNDTETTGAAAQGTWVRANCNGFVAGNLDASVLLSRDWVLPVINEVPQTDEVLAGLPSNSPRSDNRVRADFKINLESGSGFMGQTRLNHPFCFKNREDVVIEVATLALDLSDAVNPEGLAFPDNYNSPHVVDDVALPSWQGFFMTGLEVELPEQFRREGGEEMEIGVPLMIVDRTGFTADLYATNILPLGEKKAGSWGFAVDSFALRITQNQFEEVKLTGLINIPLLAGAAANCQQVAGPDGEPINPDGWKSEALRPEDCLKYRAIIQAGNNYYFGVETSTDYCVDIWQAELTIRKNSRLDLVYTDNEFVASSTLYGSIDVDATLGEAMELRIDSLPFDSLVLTTASPHFYAGRWGTPKVASATVGAFSLSFSHIKMAEDSSGILGGGNDVAASSLNFRARLSMDSDLHLDAQGVFRVIGTLGENDDRQKWTFRKFKVDAISIEASNDAFRVRAAIAFFERSDEWGTGFYGAGQLFVTAIGGDVGLSAVAQFGQFPNEATGEEERYFFVDMIAAFGPGIPIAGLSLKAAGGGVYKGMSRDLAESVETFGDAEGNQGTPDSSEVVNARQKVESGDPLEGIVGVSTSGATYSVDLRNKFGAFIQVVVASEGNEEAFSVNARLELALYESGGWRAFLEGNIMLMGPVNYTNEYTVEEGIGIFVNMALIKEEEYFLFRATADVFAEVQGGKLKGAAPVAEMKSDSAGSNRELYVDGGIPYAGGIALEFGTDGWFLHVGFPPTVSGESQTTGSKEIALGTEIMEAEVTVRTYFCVGANVPPIPALPANVRAIAGQMDMNRGDLSQYSSAAGFAFGAHVDIAAEGTLVIFTYDLAAGAGFDINVRNYGDATCGDGDRIGVDGWYAMGQAHAYITAEVGIKLPRWLGGAEVPILDAGVAAVIQVKAPNPVWGRGRVAGYYNVAGGLLKGDFSVTAEFGTSCTIQGSGGGDPLLDIDVLTSVTPGDDATNVATDAIPLASMLVSVGQPTEMDGKEYQVYVTHAELRDLDNGIVVADEATFNPEGSYSFEVYPEEFLRGETLHELMVRIEVKWRPYSENNGPDDNWTFLKNEGDTVRFTTGPDLDYIPESNIVHTWPVSGQRNFHREENGTGFVTLKRKQPSLVEDVSAVFNRNNGGRIVENTTFNENKKRYEFSTTDLGDARFYRFRLVQHLATGGNTPPTQSPNQVPAASGRYMITLPNVDGLDAVVDGEEKELLTYFFRTSTYSTFDAKVAALLPGSANFVHHGSHGPVVNLTGKESFDVVELNGTNNDGDKLVRLSVGSSETYTRKKKAPHQGSIKDLIYGTHGVGWGANNWTQGIPSAARNLLNGWRSAPLPYGAVTFVNAGGGLNPLVTESAFASSNNSPTGGQFRLSFPKVVYDKANAYADAMKTAIDAKFEEEFDIRTKSCSGGGNTVTLRYPYYTGNSNISTCFPGLQQLINNNPSCPSVTSHTPSTISADGINIIQFGNHFRHPNTPGNPANNCNVLAGSGDVYDWKGAPPPYRGTNYSYPVSIRYVLPDGTQGYSSTKTFSIGSGL